MKQDAYHAWNVATRSAEWRAVLTRPSGPRAAWSRFLDRLRRGR